MPLSAVASCLNHCVHLKHKFWQFGSKLLHKLIILQNKSHFIVCLIKSLELLRWQELSIMQQFRASAFDTVVHQINWVKWKMSIPYLFLSLGYLCAKNYQIWWRFDEVLTKTTWVILAHPIVFFEKTINPYFTFFWGFYLLSNLQCRCYSAVSLLTTSEAMLSNSFSFLNVIFEFWRHIIHSTEMRWHGEWCLRCFYGS